MLLVKCIFAVSVYYIYSLRLFPCIAQVEPEVPPAPLVEEMQGRRPGDSDSVGAGGRRKSSDGSKRQPLLNIQLSPVLSKEAPLM